MSSLNIVGPDHPMLHTLVRPITPEQINHPVTQALIFEMQELLRKTSSVGLAINQVGLDYPPMIVIEDLQAYIDQVPMERRRPFLRDTPIPFHALFSPTMEPRGNDVCHAFVSCASVPGVWGAVPYHWSIRVTAYNEEGKEILINAIGWYSLILQHEINHLEGIVFTDIALKGSVMPSRTFFAKQWGLKTSSEIARAFGAKEEV
ncbi:MAG: peptide deformylase [Patescibacteria group bacterium]